MKREGKDNANAVQVADADADDAVRAICRSRISNLSMKSSRIHRVFEYLLFMKL